MSETSPASPLPEREREQARPKRRPRYRGTHPRSFHEKYKEHNPVRYADDVAQIMASGKTPAGMHRPILVSEVLHVLAPQPGEIAVDCTLGYGGHAEELLRAVLPGGRLLALDIDPIELPKTEARLRAAGYPPEVLTVHRSNYAGLSQVLAAEQVSGANLILADLGLSSMQIDNPGRGFTFKRTGPLDLRMNPERGPSAAQLLATIEAPALERLLLENADEPRAAYLAGKITSARSAQPIRTTTDLVTVIRQAVHALPGYKSLSQAPAQEELTIRRVFQALRIEVNDEFGALQHFLRRLPECLQPGGRVAIITFHSGEDRRVKKCFREGLASGHFVRAADEVIRPTPEEIRANPRAAPAKLRWAVRG